MKKLCFLVILLLITGLAWSKPMHLKTSHTVIIDTDCAVDDMRAISLLLSRPEITVKAILLSDGALSPDEGYEKVKELLHEFGRDTIPVYLGQALKGINPPWREFNRQVSWGSIKVKLSPEKIESIGLDKVPGIMDKEISFICLGPLTNIAFLIKKDTSFVSKTEQIIWYNESVNPLAGFNYDCDKSAAEFVLNSGIRIDVISNLQKEGAVFDVPLYNLCKESKNLPGKVLNYVYSQPAVLEKLKQQHFLLWDDLAAMYITNPELFDISPLKKNNRIRFAMDYNLPAIREAYSDMITGKYSVCENVVFNHFPADREMFAYDVRQIMDSAIARYGYDEWKANVMTDEFHGHLGVFSIVGAKMGIRAREYFGVGPDVLEVVSYAGSKPPFSCMNDGIQVSTGATLGMGTITLAKDTVPEPTALFDYKGRRIQISLKKEYLEEVKKNIKEGLDNFGLSDEDYWEHIRHNSITYWLEWDRNKIFDITEIKKPAN